MKWWNGWHFVWLTLNLVNVQCSVWLTLNLVNVQCSVWLTLNLVNIHNWMYWYIYVHCWMQSYIFTYIAECSHIYLHTWLNATYRAPSELTNMKALLTTMPVWTICSQFCEYTPYLGLKCTLFFCKVYLQWCQLVKRVLLTLVTLGKWLPDQLNLRSYRWPQQNLQSYRLMRFYKFSRQ